MESALYHYTVWSHTMVQLGDGGGLGPGTWSYSLETSLTQNVAWPYAWRGKVILLKCMRFGCRWLKATTTYCAVHIL